MTTDPDLQLSSGHRLLLFAYGLAIGAANLYCFTAALKHLNLAIACPVFSGATIASMVASSALFFGERIAYAMDGGCVVVVIGALTHQNCYPS